MSAQTPEHEWLAMSYLTGQATAEQVAQYRRLFANDARFRATVREVEIWLAPLNEGVEDVPVPPGLLDDLMGEIDRMAAHEHAGRVSPDPVASNDNSTGVWKAIAGAASAVAVIAIGSHFVGPSGAPQDPSPIGDTTDGSSALLALLSDDTQPELMAIVYDPRSSRVVARLSNIDVPDDGDLQLWLIREGAEAPMSLGVLERTSPDAALPERVRLRIGTRLQERTDTLAVSLEARGGSTSNGPQGPILYTGAVSELGLN